MAHGVFRQRSGMRPVRLLVAIAAATSLLLLAVPSVANASPAVDAPAPPTASSLLSSAPASAPVPMREPSNAAAFASPQAYSPAGCRLYVSNYPHLAKSLSYSGVKVFESASCTYPVSKLYFSVSLYKTDFWGSYYESNGSNTNYYSTYVGAGAGVYCSDLTQNTTFYGVAYSYSQEGGITYSDEGVSPSVTLKCGTPGGWG